MQRLSKLLALILLALVGALGGYLSARFLPDNLSPWELLLGLLLGYLLNTLVHELGHALAGVQSGLHLALLAVGPLQYQPGRSLRWRPSPALGFAYLLPPTEVSLERLIVSYRRMIASGPLLGLLFSAACWALAQQVAPGGAQTLLVLVALVGLVLNVVSLLPLKSSSLLTDGSRLLRLRPGSPTARHEAALLSLIAVSRRDRPREWPPELLAEAQQEQGAPVFNATARQYAALAALDHGQSEQAQALLQEAWQLTQGLAPVMRAGFQLERAYLAARQGHAAQARELLRSVPRSPFQAQVTLHRVRAAVLLAEGQAHEAQKVIAQARAELDDPLALPALESAWLDDLLLDIQALPTPNPDLTTRL